MASAPGKHFRYNIGGKVIGQLCFLLVNTLKCEKERKRERKKERERKREREREKERKRCEA